MQNFVDVVLVVIFGIFIGIMTVVCGCNQSSTFSQKNQGDSTKVEASTDLEGAIIVPTTEGNIELCVTLTTGTPGTTVRVSVVKALQQYILDVNEGEKSVDKLIEEIKCLRVEMPDGNFCKLSQIKGIKVEVKNAQ